MLAEGSFGKVFMFLLAACCFNLPIAFVYCLLPIAYCQLFIQTSNPLVSVVSTSLI